MGATHDGRILVHRGGEGSNPRMGRFYTDGCFGYTDTCGTVVIPLIYDYADSFSNGFAVVGKGEKNDRRFGLIDRQGREVVPCIYAVSPAMEKGILNLPGNTDSSIVGVTK
ncbi:WG repeat-containing protein [Alistipes putredinis]|uniref:WG repeat-containing protein n=1 Tax=Alistipes putredinis TaxID=28117 RepID=UPI003A86D1B3